MPTLKVNEIVSYSGNTLTIGASTDTLSYVGAVVKADTIQNASASNLVVQTNTTTITIGRSGQTISIPSGATLSNSGTLSGFGLTLSAVKTSGFTAVAGNLYPCDTTSAAFTVTLPASATAGDQIGIVDYAGTFATNILTINPNGLKIQSQTSNVTVSKANEALTLTYIDSTSGWLVTSGANQGTSAIALPYSIDFLVIAGGGGGAGAGATWAQGGGGGAGGYRLSTQSVGVGTVITVTVGDGGSGGAAYNKGVSGSNSSISGGTLTTITSAGGGGGGGHCTGQTGNTGGSGGGAGTLSCSAGGPDTGLAGNTPSTTPSQGNSGGNSTTYNYGSAASGGGGGGAGGTGGNGSSGTGGAGGAGSASSITGSSVTRASGGGGGGSSTGGTAPAGGGGNGGGNGAGSAASANTGGGGGAAGEDGTGTSTGGAGGKGVVILSMLTTKYSGTTTGSPTVTTSGSNTILQFNGSGSYTA